MNIKLVKSKDGKEIKAFDHKGNKVATVEYNESYEILFQNNNVAYVKGKLDRHNKFKITKIGLDKRW